MENSAARDIVYQSNNLVEAIYDSDLTAMEHKVLRFAASKIRENSNNFPNVTFTVREFVKAAGLKGNNYHELFEKIGDELTRKRIKIKNDKETGWFPWLSSLVYKEGVVHLSFNILIKDLLLELKSGYTQYQFGFIGDMRSAYTIRLFELIKQYAKIGKRRIKVETLKQMLGIGDKYKHYGQFKLRVLSQAKKELDEKGGITFEFEEIKEGRKVVEIVFHIKGADKFIEKDLSKVESNLFLTEAQLLLDRFNYYVKPEEIRSWEKYGIDLLVDSLNEIKENNRLVEDPGPYIRKMLESKYKKNKQTENKKTKPITVENDPSIVGNIHKETSEEYYVAAFVNEYIIDKLIGYRANTKREITPWWLIRNKFFNYLAREGIEDKNRQEEIWEKFGDHIIKETGASR